MILLCSPQTKIEMGSPTIPAQHQGALNRETARQTRRPSVSHHGYYGVKQKVLRSCHHGATRNHLHLWSQNSFPLLGQQCWPRRLNVMLTEGHGIQTASHETVPAEPEKWSLRSGRKPFPAAGPAGSDGKRSLGHSPCSADPHQMDPGSSRRRGARPPVCAPVHMWAWEPLSPDRWHTFTSILEIKKLRLRLVK